MLKSSNKLSVASAMRQKMTRTNAAIEAAKSKHGDKASLSAAWCAFAARCEGREDDYRFWLNVFKGLAGRQDNREVPVTSQTNADGKL
ncbi:hypothetical protein [Mesorhizobium sp. DCY119]|uniref:hypothetical protein n=1 Tax=Mesorhizobium sp. DCY119 TaxID=2108445 RepID=UPI000E7168F1|nr:hypothetical protein [Mesorhizobium sp. DCY119]RJG40942.1 hypothetical protein D3Y55_27375 [Mesorhizobium sp. DCY119]